MSLFNIRFTGLGGRLTVLSVLVAAVSSASAQRAELPSPRVGDQWQFAVYYTVPSAEPNRVWAVTAVRPDGIEGTENGEPLLLTPELNVRESPRERYTNHQALRFPLEVGKQWRYSTDWHFKPKKSSGSHAISVSVVGHEKVSVPAGEFDAFKVVAKGNVSGVSPIRSIYAAEITMTYWYAPNARAIVKSISHNPYIGTTTVELVRYRLSE